MSENPSTTISKWLKTIKKSKCFRDKIKVYAPTCYGECLPTVEKLIRDLNNIFYGSTVYDATGTWLDPQGRLETEPVKVIEIAHKCTNRRNAQLFSKAIMEYGAKASQHSISINNESEFYIARSPQLAKAYVKEMKRARKLG